jgi:hypothetical protein
MSSQLSIITGDPELAAELVGFSPWVELLFPAWILALSIDILAAGLRPPAHATGRASEK